MRKSKPPRQPSSARDSALRVLGRREHSALQLRRKLKARGYDEATAGETVGDLTERGWQSDTRYAEMLVRSRVAQGYGRLYIEAELGVAGVPDADVAAALEVVECDWTQLAIELHARKFGASPVNLAERNKRYRYLAGRGFTSEQIRAALKGVVPDED